MADNETNTNPDPTNAPDTIGTASAGAASAGAAGAPALPADNQNDGDGDDNEPPQSIEVAAEKVDKTEAKGTQPLERDPDAPREVIRSDLARGLLWLLTITIGAVIFFVGLGQVPSDVLTQSIFPSLVTLTGTALGFYFGAQTAKKE
jgi:hypothetical protein